MKMRILLAAIVLGIVGTSSAAQLSNAQGQSCGSADGVWHFVNNQTGGATAPGTLTAQWSSGDTCVVPASKVNQNTQHFYCTASGTLLGGSTTLPGRLVLSDFTCGVEPPECDPKTEKCECDPKYQECKYP